ncbi:MAG: hypothetical protein LBF55_06430, partial [Prevotellaceae bacterium]|nr:hypothetical protein [Prevotellaceae bacterium]
MAHYRCNFFRQKKILYTQNFFIPSRCLFEIMETKRSNKLMSLEKQAELLVNSAKFLNAINSFTHRQFLTTHGRML